MSDDKTGGPAFPAQHSIDGNWVKEPLEGYTGMTLRDWFAGQANESDIAPYIPTTVGGVADLLVRLGWITQRARDADVIRCYGDAEMRRLRAWARYQHADAMLEARKK